MDRTAFYKAQQKEAVKAGEAGDDVTAGQVLLMSKAELQERVLSDKRINIYECGRRDIKAGMIDRRILALVEYLAVKGVQPTITSLICGHGYYTPAATSPNTPWAPPSTSPPPTARSSAPPPKPRSRPIAPCRRSSSSRAP